MPKRGQAQNRGLEREVQDVARQSFSMRSRGAYVSMYVCTYVCMYVCMHVCLRVFVQYVYDYTSFQPVWGLRA